MKKKDGEVLDQTEVTSTLTHRLQKRVTADLQRDL